MPNPLHAAHYADSAVQRSVRVVENVRVARDTFRVRFESDEIARSIVPGQFLMMRLAGANDPLIGRAFAFYDTVLADDGEPCAIDVVYLAKGKFTRRLAELGSGQQLDVWGPLGNGFPADAVEHLIMVAGGIGQTPFVALAAEFLGRRRYGTPARQVVPANRATLCYGARTAEMLAGIEDFQRLGVQVRVATDDGSRGHHGLVTEVLEQVLDEDDTPHRIVCCGPEIMMQAVARLAARRGSPCQVSLETPMACGIGICFTCVAKVKDAEGGWDYKRTCVEGPVFDAARIEW
ncbi:MAG: dihydroorotate dehydrogenase electron transfer subunit [Pirellulaceae bacterium]|nr:dihydroorotate dehydrogenase electron transfer subunit [Pirellulaceae bacterium]